MRYNQHPGSQSPLTQVLVSNVERGYRDGLQQKSERNTEDLCLLCGDTRVHLRGSRDPGNTAESTTVYSFSYGFTIIVLEYNVSIPASCS